MSKDTVIAHLNRILALDLAAINQSFLHARILNNQGLEELGEHFYKRSIHLMKEADALIERALLLHETPNLQDMGKVGSGDTAPSMLAADLDLEKRRHMALTQAIAFCEQQQDFVSRALITRWLDSNEEYIDWLETQEGLIEAMGLPNYLQSGMDEE